MTHLSGLADSCRPCAAPDMEPCKMTDLFLVKIKLAISGRAAARCQAVMSQAAASARVHKLFYLGQF